MKNNKSPCRDGIAAEIAKNEGKTAIVVMYPNV